MGGDEHERIQVLRRLVLLAPVQEAELPRALGVLAGEHEVPRAELDDRQVPERARGEALVALAPLDELAREQRAGPLELARPDEDVREREGGIRRGLRIAGGERMRLLGELAAHPARRR